jgi:hypothetical protein
MTLSIRPTDPVNRPFFAGEVSGIDLRATMTGEQVAGIVEGMDKFAVLVFHEQQIDDAQQLAFSRNFGTLEIANSDVRRDEERRLAPEIADVSNLGQATRSCRARTGDGSSASATCCGTRTARSSRPRPSIHCCMRASCRSQVPSETATPSSPTCAPPTTRSTTR